MIAYSKREKAYGIGSVILKTIFGLIIGFFVLQFIFIFAFLIRQAISYYNARSDAYIAAEKLVKSNKLIGKNHDDVISLLNIYHEENEDFGTILWDKYNPNSYNSYSLKCTAGSAYDPFGSISPYYLIIDFNASNNVTEVHLSYPPQ